MKKVIAVILMMVLAITMVVNGYAENFKDYLWFDNDIKDYTEAEQYGEKIPGYGYLYEGILYYDTELWLNIDPMDFGLSEEEYYRLDDVLEKEFEKIGIKHVNVYLMQAGIDYNDEWIYDVEVYTIYNLNVINDNEDSRLGSGFVGEGIEYYGIRMITHIKEMNK